MSTTETAKKAAWLVASLIMWIWQLPQNLVGLGVRAWYAGGAGSRRYEVRNKFGMRIEVTECGMRGGISLGQTIVMHRCMRHDPLALPHELGHTMQSMMLGPAYLLIVGLPSIAWAGMKSAGMWRGRDYYSFYTERWADKLSDIERRERKKM